MPGATGEDNLGADGKTVEREGCWQELRDQQAAMWQRRNAMFKKRYKLGTDGPTFGRGGRWQNSMDEQEAMWQARNREFLERANKKGNNAPKNNGNILGAGGRWTAIVVAGSGEPVCASL